MGNISKTEYHKTVSIQPDPLDQIDGLEIEGYRWRNSNDSSIIGVRINGKKIIELSNDESGYGDKYELVARVISDMLGAAAYERCLLPTEES